MPAEVLRLSGEIARLQSGEAITTECRLQRKNGTHFVAEVTAKRLPDGTLQAFARDITARKLSDEALRDSESRLRVRSAPVASACGIGTWSRGCVYFSSEWKHQVGHSDDEISDSFEEARRRVHPDDLAPMLSQIQAFLSSDQPTFESEFRFRHKDGTYRRIPLAGIRKSSTPAATRRACSARTWTSPSRSASRGAVPPGPEDGERSAGSPAASPTTSTTC